MRLLNKFVLSAYLRGGHPPILGSESPLLPLLSESNLEGRLGTPSLHARFSRHVRCQCELSDRERVCLGRTQTCKALPASSQKEGIQGKWLISLLLEGLWADNIPG